MPSAKPQGKTAKDTFRSKLLEDAIFNDTPTNKKSTAGLDHEENTKNFSRTMYNKFKADLGLPNQLLT